MTALSAYDDPARYDRENGWGADDAFYLALALECGSPVLDFGCGTGRLARAMGARGLSVTGVDASPPMLSRARWKSPGTEFIDGDIRTVRLGRRFALAIMTGHGFQHLLTTADQQAAIETVRAHLAPGGVFAFDILNRAPVGGYGRSVWDPKTHVATYFLDGVSVSLRFTDVRELDRLLAGFVVERRYGDWPDIPFGPDSPELITVCRAAPAG